jgi:hypothetical protein
MGKTGKARVHLSVTQIWEAWQKIFLDVAGLPSFSNFSWNRQLWENWPNITSDFYFAEKELHSLCHLTAQNAIIALAKSSMKY